MSKNIILLSDGTGNSSAKLFKTNVWRLFQTLDLTDPGKQVAYYDDGVGTSSFKLFAVLGGVFGFGLKRNVIDIYSFCCRNYLQGDKIYGFGFSRGAFTMRVVAGLIARQGLVPYNGDEAALARYAVSAYRDYRRRFNSTKGLVTPLRNMRDRIVKAWRRIRGQKQYNKADQIDVPSIHFLGLWDTVDAYGGPIEEITRAIDYWYWPLSMPDRFMNAKYHRACHALAIEDERDAFRPVLWDERYTRRTDDKLHAINYGWKPDVSPDWEQKLKPIDRQRLSQVWFVGVHSDIGGGYPQDGLSYVTLDWMIDRAEPFGLLLDPAQREQLRPLVNPYDKLNDSRHGLAGYYRYKPRNIHEIYNAPPYKPSFRSDLEYMRGELIGGNNTQKDVVSELSAGTSFEESPPPIIHQAVFDRIDAIDKPDPTKPFKVATDGYIPIVLPQSYHVTDKDGQLKLSNYSGDPEPPRCSESVLVWNRVWWKRVVYFLTLFVSVALAAVPLLDNPTLGADTPLVLIRPLLALAAAFLPGFVAPWFEAYGAAPGLFVLGVVVLGALLWLGGWLQDNIRNVMRAIWIKQPPAAGIADRIAVSIRTRAGYRIFFYALKHWWLPSLFALLILWVLFALASQLAFRTADAFGAFCATTQSGQPNAGGGSVMFQTSDFCKPTQIKVIKDEEYRVTIKVDSEWIDSTIPATPEGFGFQKMTLPMYPWIVFRRVLFAEWFKPVLRIGNRGGEEHVLDMKANPAGQVKTYEALLKPRSDGEVFVFVNDAVWGLPWVYNYFYSNNHPGKNDPGPTSITIEPLRPVR
jgi:uncharacterized protein (DUF2235 family)